MNVCPPIVSTPVRNAPVFAAQLNAIVPFPLPEAPDVSHEALLLAVQLHPVAVVTLTDPEPAVAGTLRLPDESE